MSQPSPQDAALVRVKALQPLSFGLPQRTQRRSRSSDAHSDAVVASRSAFAKTRDAR